MNVFEKIKGYNPSKHFDIIKGDSFVVIKFNDFYSFVQKPTKDIPNGRIVEFKDEDTIIYDNVFTENKAKWIESNMYTNTEIIND